MILKKHTNVCSLLLASSFVWICCFSVGPVAGQKKPTEFDSRSDDKQLCSTGNRLDTRCEPRWGSQSA